MAFYEPAPRTIARSMQRALNERCVARGVAGSAESSEPSSLWYCAHKSLKFFRAVDLLGNRLQVGFACREGSVTPNLRYYPADMFGEEDVQCVSLSYYVVSKRHLVEDP